MKTNNSDLVILDIGSSKIAAISAELEFSGDAIINGQVLHESQGFKAGTITDWKKAEESVVGAIYSLEQEIGSNIKEAHLVIDGADSKSYYTYTSVKASSQQITALDVKRVIHKALEEFKVAGHDVIHNFPLEFYVDGAHAVANPVGMLGKELSCKIHIVTANSSHLLNIANCLIKCQVETASFSSASYVDGLACLTENEREIGCMLIDIGARTTSLAVFLDNKLLYSYNVPIGSAHITSDISKIFSVSINVAEKLKVVFGNASLDEVNEAHVINLEDIDPKNIENFDRNNITVGELVEVINARVMEILELLKKQYDSVDIDHLIARKIVLTGGGAMLSGLAPIVSQKFNKQVKIARLDTYDIFAGDYNHMMFAAAIGVLQNQIRRQKKFAAKAKDKTSSFFQKITSWLKENI